ncbi:uncharacterized protein LOC126832829 isoform X1 [Adelges cooleyi]|uniref:uncharacterized protein LOC126832829 isoform X1 n=1 Tax=Adelges cooleyi TaxID=133065 RepID=UPI00217FF169|nr:uncharacterized protein LOC126832829 isoform X1 [Adelges cooleyi]
MHFKIAVILCALYFITSAWSNGLSKAQIETVAKMYKGNEKSLKKICKMAEHFGIKNPKLFECGPENPESTVLEKFLIALATDDNTIAGESKEGKVIDADTVVLYIELFHSFDVDGNGVISGEECPNLVKILTKTIDMSENIKEKKLAVEKLENNVATLNDEINLAEFLKIIIPFEIDIE